MDATLAKSVSFTLSLLVTVLFILCPITSPARAGWVIETVDSGYSVGSFASLAYDPSGYPAIAYFDGLEKVPMYAHFNGVSWDIEIVDSGENTDTGGYTGHYTSLAFDPSGNPAIAYYHYGFPVAQPIDDLMYAHFNGSSWGLTIVATTTEPYHVGSGCSLAFDPITGNPAISSVYSYSDITSWRRLLYSSFNGTDWDSDQYFFEVSGTSLAFHSNGEARIAFYSPTIGGYGTLEYLWVPGGTPITVDPEGGGGSLVLDPSGGEAIAYGVAYPYNDLRYAHGYAGGGWVSETVDSEGIVGRGASLAFDPSGNPAISYYDSTNDKIKYARHNGSDWVIENVGDAGTVTPTTSLVFDPSGNPTIAYRNSDIAYGLMFARFSGASAEPASEVVPTALVGVRPNPANPRATVSYRLARMQHVRMDLFDLRGRRVRALVDEVLGAGSHEAVFDGKDEQGQALASGIYFVRLDTDDGVFGSRVTLIQ